MKKSLTLLALTLAVGVAGFPGCKPKKKKAEALEKRVADLEKVVVALAKRKVIPNRLKKLEKQVKELDLRIMELDVAQRRLAYKLSAPITGIRKTGPNRYDVDTAFVNRFVSNAAEAGRGARILPHVKNGKAVGFRLEAIQKDSVYFLLGLKNGDVVKSINKVDLTSPDKALDLFIKLKGAKKFTIEILRKGKPVQIAIRVVRPKKKKK
jgi:C-terminal processing protease CtpA/Prc